MCNMVRAFFTSLAFAIVGTHTLAADTSSRSGDLTVIVSRIQQVKSEPDPIVRERAAAELASDIQQTDRASLENATIGDLMGLLNDDSDAVRYRVAMAIAAAGPRARSAAPALENAFELAKQYMLYIQHRNFIVSGVDYYTGTSSVDPICFALQEIGAPGLPGCVDGHFEDTGTTVTYR